MTIQAKDFYDFLDTLSSGVLQAMAETCDRVDFKNDNFQEGISEFCRVAGVAMLAEWGIDKVHFEEVEG